MHCVPTSQLLSSPVVDVPSTAQSPSNPATKADVSSRYQPPLKGGGGGGGGGGGSPLKFWKTRFRDNG